MKVCEVPLFVVSLLGFGLLSSVEPPPAHADFTFGPAVNLGPVVNSDFYDSDPYISADGLSLYFSSDRANTVGGIRDLWVTTRASVLEPWGPPVNLGPTVNDSVSSNWAPCISSDGLELYFMRPYPGYDLMYSSLWVTRRATPSDPWGPPVNIWSCVPSDDGTGGCYPRTSADGLSLFFGHGITTHQWVTTRPTKDSPWGQAVMLENLASLGQSYWSCMSADGLAFFFQSDDSSTPGYDFGAWLMTRHSTAEAWGTAYRIGLSVNDLASTWGPVSISADGFSLYFYSARSGGFGQTDLWQVPITPNCDFNGDGKVDDGDLPILQEHLGQNYPLCDIGPSPWGDGMVDWRDLKVFVEYAASPIVQASDVPANVALSWVSPWLSETHDVYFGTSLEDVRSADRDHPLGVLVSTGQTAATYDPPGLLEYGRTYYWRVDEVNAAPDSTISKGNVRRFTVETFSSPVKPTKATASSFDKATTQAAKTIDRSGLNSHDEHGVDVTTMWVSRKSQSPVWIQYEFDRAYRLDQMWVWNANDVTGLAYGLGAKDVTIQTSLDKVTWTTLADVPEFAQGTGKPDYVHNTTVDFKGAAAKYVKLTIDSNWGEMFVQYSLSEVRFFYIPDRTY